MASKTLYASAARTATPTAQTFRRGRYSGLHLIIDATAVTATPSVVCTIDGYDPVSGKYYNLLTSAAITATGTTVLKIAPGATAAANLAANDRLPDTVRVTMTHGDADSITYSVGATLIP